MTAPPSSRSLPSLPLSFCFSHFFAHSSLVSLFSEERCFCRRISFIRVGRDQERIARGKKEKGERSSPKVEEGNGGGGGKSRENENFNADRIAADDDRSFSVIGYQEGREVEESALTVFPSFVPLDFLPLFSSRGEGGGIWRLDALDPNERKKLRRKFVKGKRDLIIPLPPLQTLFYFFTSFRGHDWILLSIRPKCPVNRTREGLRNSGNSSRVTMRISIETPLSTPIDFLVYPLPFVGIAVFGDAAVFRRRFEKMEFLSKVSNNWYKPVSFKSDFLPVRKFFRSPI